MEKNGINLVCLFYYLNMLMMKIDSISLPQIVEKEKMLIGSNTLTY